MNSKTAQFVITDHANSPEGKNRINAIETKDTQIALLSAKLALKPTEVIVEKIVEVPVEKIVEVIVEKIVEVPVKDVICLDEYSLGDLLSAALKKIFRIK